MAIMIPENVEEFKTEGERQFYKFLEVVAKPDSRHITWYTPNIEGKEPDFILFSQNVGLIIFEIKDWILDQIQEINPQYFRLQIGNKIESRKNPFQQSRDYLYDIVDKIKKDGHLIARDTVSSQDSLTTKHFSRKLTWILMPARFITAISQSTKKVAGQKPPKIIRPTATMRNAPIT